MQIIYKMIKLNSIHFNCKLLIISFSNKSNICFDNLFYSLLNFYNLLSFSYYFALFEFSIGGFVNLLMT